MYLSIHFVVLFNNLIYFIVLKGDCDENSVCKFNANGVCVCPQGILGSKCDKNKFCPCSNNGTCLNNSDTNPKCICKHGFEGNLCQYKGMIS